jgi:hypothetical protein
MNNTPKYRYTDENTITITWESEITFSFNEIHEWVTESYGDDYTFSDVIKELEEIQKINQASAPAFIRHRFGNIEKDSLTGRFVDKKVISHSEYGETEKGKAIMERLRKGE